MKGTWLGYYKHKSKLLPENIRDRFTKFKIIIDEFDGIKFKGTVEDDITTGGTQGTGVIEGLKRGNEISFIKKMPVETMVLPSGKIKTTNKKHPKIYYSGIISTNENEVKRSWKFKLGIIWVGTIQHSERQ